MNVDYGVDLCHYYALPGLIFDACLKFTGQELDLFTNSEMVLFIENAIRGGISVVSHRYAKANSPPPLVPDYDPNSPQPSSIIGTGITCMVGRSQSVQLLQNSYF